MGAGCQRHGGPGERGAGRMGEQRGEQDQQRHQPQHAQGGRLAGARGVRALPPQQGPKAAGHRPAR